MSRRSIAQHALDIDPKTRSRRELLTAGAFTALAGIAAVAVALPDPAPPAVVIPRDHADAELIAECERFVELEHQIAAAHAACPQPEDVGIDACFAAEEAILLANEPLEAEQQTILARMHGLRARTLDGHRMRARVLAAYHPEIEKEGQAGHVYNQQIA